MKVNFTKLSAITLFYSFSPLLQKHSTQLNNQTVKGGDPSQRRLGVTEGTEETLYRFAPQDDTPLCHFERSKKSPPFFFFWVEFEEGKFTSSNKESLIGTLQTTLHVAIGHPWMKFQSLIGTLQTCIFQFFKVHFKICPCIIITEK